MNDLAARLAFIVAAATRETSTVRSRDDHKLLAALDDACHQAQACPAEMAPVLERLEAAAAVHRRHPALAVRDRLRATRENCLYLIARARYRALRRAADRCDCAARIQAAFLFHRPDAPLELVETEHLWRCRACGTTWHEEDGTGDLHSWAEATP